MKTDLSVCGTPTFSQLFFGHVASIYGYVVRSLHFPTPKKIQKKIPIFLKSQAVF